MAAVVSLDPRDVELERLQCAVLALTAEVEQLERELRQQRAAFGVAEQRARFSEHEHLLERRLWQAATCARSPDEAELSVTALRARCSLLERALENVSRAPERPLPESWRLAGAL